MIDDELEGAQNYVDAANHYRLEHPKTADEFVKLAEVEMGHAMTLHKEVVKLIEEVRTQRGEPPKEMMAIYEFEHGKYMKRAALIRTMIEGYKQQ
jgi:hypothetical protein